MSTKKKKNNNLWEKMEYLGLMGNVATNMKDWTFYTKRYPDMSAVNAKLIAEDAKLDQCWQNNHYMVLVRRRTGPGWFDASCSCFNGFPETVGEITWLSIRRLDRKPIHDWRHFQKIKNDIVGEEAEAVEIYPAESRLTDTANQYHLFAYTPHHTKGKGFEGFAVPLGFIHRHIQTNAEASQIGAVQRD